MCSHICYLVLSPENERMLGYPSEHLNVKSRRVSEECVRNWQMSEFLVPVFCKLRREEDPTYKSFDVKQGNIMIL